LFQVAFKPKNITFLTRRDGFGDSLYHGSIDSLKQHGFCHSGFLINGDYISAEDSVVLYLMSLFHPKIMIMG
jgi:hypothetical protein